MGEGVGCVWKGQGEWRRLERERRGERYSYRQSSHVYQILMCNAIPWRPSSMTLSENSTHLPKRLLFARYQVGIAKLYYIKNPRTVPHLGLLYGKRKYLIFYFLVLSKDMRES